MNPNANCSYCPSQPVRRAIAIAVAAVLVSLAFGVGLPWIVIDAPPQTETLWARQVQTRTLASIPPIATPVRTAPRRAAR